MLVITPGEPGGVGPDIALRLFQEAREQPVLVIADPELLQARADALRVAMSFETYEQAQDRVSLDAGTMTVMPTYISGSKLPGRLDPDNVAGVMRALDRAISGCLDGEFAGLVTGPMQKSVVNDAGLSFTGHTEYLAERSGIEDVVMLLANTKMRVALATTHVPLKDVSGVLTMELLVRRLRILESDLRLRFQIRNPRILVAGLNPHAGEGGHLGREEIEVIEPACAVLRAEGMDLVGPLPADTIFTDRHLGNCDAVLAMFHDQGLPVLKYSGFGEAVNITLGLPFVRTSVDHGTALDVAGSGLVDCSSMRQALAMAGWLIRSREST
ncbi:MAG: 4-hydroxythreonine-4-phosphate dehydrogenase PdxA [Pseudomonadales bacterium]|nr:4-hydroxythreonine-4-phosphate dehydrogenase PdxA [Pseudomonadales bacterium]